MAAPLPAPLSVRLTPTSHKHSPLRVSPQANRASIDPPPHCVFIINSGCENHNQQTPDAPSPQSHGRNRSRRVTASAAQQSRGQSPNTQHLEASCPENIEMTALTNTSGVCRCDNHRELRPHPRDNTPRAPPHMPPDLESRKPRLPSRHLESRDLETEHFETRAAPRAPRDPTLSSSSPPSSTASSSSHLQTQDLSSSSSPRDDSPSRAHHYLETTAPSRAHLPEEATRPNTSKPPSHPEHLHTSRSLPRLPPRRRLQPPRGAFISRPPPCILETSRPLGSST